MIAHAMCMLCACYDVATKATSTRFTDLGSSLPTTREWPVCEECAAAIDHQEKAVQS